LVRSLCDVLLCAASVAMHSVVHTEVVGAASASTPGRYPLLTRRGDRHVAAHQDIWALSAMAAAVASMALIVATFTPWWGFAFVINSAILYVAVQSAIAQPTG
jgi:hypothetical protein